MKTINEKIKIEIQNCVENYRDEADFENNLGNTLHEFLSFQSIHATDEDENEFCRWENYAFSLL